jgi:hypothetical protein
MLQRRRCDRHLAPPPPLSQCSLEGKLSTSLCCCRDSVGVSMHASHHSPQQTLQGPRSQLGHGDALLDCRPEAAADVDGIQTRQQHLPGGIVAP